MKEILAVLAKLLYSDETNPKVT